jgi:hypothetical protein
MYDLFQERVQHLFIFDKIRKKKQIICLKNEALDYISRESNMMSESL